MSAAPAAPAATATPGGAPAPAAGGSQGFHVVQVGYDESVFRKEGRSDTVGRQSLYCAELRRHAPGARMTFLVLTREKGFAAFEEGGVAYRPVRFRRRFQIPVLVWRTLERLHAADPIDVVTTQTAQEDGLGATVFRKLRRVALVTQVHIDIFHPEARRENFGPAPWRWLMGPVSLWSLGKCDAVRVAGTRIRKRLEERKLPGRVHVIPVAMPLLGAPFAGSPGRGRKVVFAGRLVKEKRLDLWLEIAAEVARRDPAARFELAGDGPLRADLEAKAKALGLDGKVAFLGRVPYERLADLYASAAVFLLTSPAESFGRVAAEAMHFEVPVVGFRVTGVEDIVKDGETGFLPPFGNVPEAAAGVARLLAEPSLRDSMGAAAKRAVDAEFHPDRLARDWMHLLLKTGRPLNYGATSLVKARRPTWERWKALSGMKYSLQRGLLYEAIRGLRFEGKTLDVGGGSKNSYYGLLEFAGPVENINIDTTISPTYLFDLNQPMPLPDGAYDNVISLNTYEHIFRDEVALRESLRVLRKGGRFVFSTPFLYKVHGSPSDHHRHTAFWWHEFLVSQGVRPEDFRIEPLVWDPLSTALSITNFEGKGWLRKLVMLKPLLSLRHGRQERVPHHAFDDFPLAYLITGTK